MLQFETSCSLAQKTSLRLLDLVDLKHLLQFMKISPSQQLIVY